MGKITITVDESFIEELKGYAEFPNPSHKENFDICDYTADNVFDAYMVGRDCAESDMAQWVLDVITNS